MSITVVRIGLPINGVPIRHLILDGSREIGLIEKYRNTRTDTHPWKAFAGVGHACRYIGAFYAEDGGRDAAIKAVIAATSGV